MRFGYVKPSEALAPYIKHYWYLEINRAEGTVTERGVPIDSVELMFHYMNPFMESVRERSVEQPRFFVSGLSTDYVDAYNSGDAGVVAVSFKPCGACNFFSFPLDETEGENINLLDIDGRGLAMTEDSILSAASLAESISAIETYLLRRLKPVDSRDVALIKAGIAFIEKTKGRARTLALAKSLCCTEKTFGRKFRAVVGTTPKQYIRIARFNEVIRSFSGDGSLTDKAYENGYFDQAHFIKDFKAMSGYTPKQFLRVYPCDTDYTQGTSENPIGDF